MWLSLPFFMKQLEELFKRRNVREQLEPLLDKINVSWGQYNRNKDEATKKLVHEKLVIVPFSEKFLKMPYEWQAHRAIDLLTKLDANNQIIIIPSGSKLFRKSPSRTTLKKGNLLPVRYHKRENLDLKAAFIEQIKEVTQDKFFYGWDFEGVNYSTQEFRTVLLYDHIRAQLVHDLLKKENLKIKSFCDYKPTKGIITIRNMPSFETDAVYDDFIMEGIVLEEKVKRFPARTFDFASTHSCYKTVYAKLKFGRDYESITGKVLKGAREGREASVDHHVILAMHLAQEELAKKGIHIYNPFVKANLATVEIFDKLHHNVLLDYMDAKKQKRKSLDIAHIENMLWNNIAYENRRSLQKHTR